MREVDWHKGYGWNGKHSGIVHNYSLDDHRGVIDRYHNNDNHLG